MTEEEMQRKMEFIIAQQAQFAVNMDLLSEKVNLIGDRVNSLGDRVDQLAAAQERTVKSLEQTVRVQNHLIQVVSTMVEAQVHTDERLNSLINVVERFISEGRNGTSQG